MSHARVDFSFPIQCFWVGVVAGVGVGVEQIKESESWHFWIQESESELVSLNFKIQESESELESLHLEIQESELELESLHFEIQESESF